MTSTSRILLALLGIVAAPGLFTARADSAALGHASVSPPEPSEQLTMHGASIEQERVVRSAIERFDEQGLALPPLDVTLHDDREQCHGYNGTHQRRGAVAYIELCSTKAHTVLHELAHAWDRWNATEEARDAFMDLLGLATWHDPNVPWSERGAEQAAMTISMVLNWKSGSISNAEFITRLCGYEVLTGNPLPESVPVTCAETPAAAISR